MNPARLNLAGSLRESVVDTLREVLTAQAPHWASLRDALGPVPADVAWLAENGEEEDKEDKMEAVIISMSRADLKASITKQPDVQASGEPLQTPAVEEQVAVGEEQLRPPSGERQGVTAAEEPLSAAEETPK